MILLQCSIDSRDLTRGDKTNKIRVLEAVLATSYLSLGKEEEEEENRMKSISMRLTCTVR